MSKTIIIMGSSAPMGDTYTVCRRLVKETGAKFEDLNELVIMPFDYDHDNRDDDYLGFIKHVVDSYDTIVLASPIYWYAVSGIMKNFIDRFTDLITIEKDIGRKLKGKKLALISVSKDDVCPADFSTAINSTAEYLGMKFLGHEHVPIGDETVAADRIDTITTMIK